MTAVILFDGVCNLCNKSVQFIIRHDTKNIFRFASLQSAFAKKYVDELINNESGFQSILLIYEGKTMVKSEAALQIAKQLNFPINLLYGFIIVPRFIRDRIYDYIAKNRYQWFGKMNECMIPDTGLKSKFLD